MRLISLFMRESVAINDIFSIKWRYYGLEKGYFGLLGNTYIFIFILLVPING